MPRDLSTYSQRLRLRCSSVAATRIQVSMSEEIIDSVASRLCAPLVRLVNIAVTPRDFRKSMTRVSIARTSDFRADRHEIGDGIDDRDVGLEHLHRVMHFEQVGFEAVTVGTLGVKLEQALVDPAL